MPPGAWVEIEDLLDTRVTVPALMNRPGGAKESIIRITPTAVNCKTLKRNTESMKKFFALAALALTLAACSKPESEIRPVENDGMITLSATLAPKGAATKALTEDGNTLKADWAQNEQLAILYMVGRTKEYTPATVKSVDAVTGAATIEFTVESGTENGTPCRSSIRLRLWVVIPGST